MQKRKILITFTVVIVILAVGGVVWRQTKLATKLNSILWSQYKDNRFDFALDYPASYIVPPEISTSEPNLDTFSFVGKTYPPAMSIEVNGKYAEKVNSLDINSWTAIDGSRNVVGTTTIAGREALMVASKNNLIFTYHGRAYQFYISNTLPLQDADRILKSFHFTN